jgi:hypothetical protein
MHTQRAFGPAKKVQKPLPHPAKGSAITSFRFDELGKSGLKAHNRLLESALQSASPVSPPCSRAPETDAALPVTSDDQTLTVYAEVPLKLPDRPAFLQCLNQCSFLVSGESETSVKKFSLQRDQTRNDQKEIFILSHFAQATFTAEIFSDKNISRAGRIFFWTAEKFSA